MPFVKKRKFQAMVEAEHQNVNIENLFLSRVTNAGIGGVSNSYTTYGQQVDESYRKYNGAASFGNQQFRSVVDIRTAFIAGEGISISSPDERFNNWVEKFAKANHFSGSSFLDSVLGSELTGKALFTLRVKPGEIPKVIRVPYSKAEPYRVILADKWDPSSVVDIVKKDKNGHFQSLGLGNFTYIRTGGDDTTANDTTTKVGIILNDCENYDRAVKDIRRLNHTVSRITPTFKTESEAETNKLTAVLKKWGWKIGQAFAGTATMKYETAGTGAVDNLKGELSTTAKNISGTSGVPVHWMGWTDLVSNKALGESLYDTIGNATIRERTLFSEGIYDLILKAQELYIDSGGTEISKINSNFEVKIPLVDFSRFLETVRALNIAYGDEVISRGDYQNMLPGINPLLTEKAIKKEQAEAEKNMVLTTEKLPTEGIENE